MIVKAYRTAKCQNVSKYDVELILAQTELKEDAREYIRLNCTPMLNCKLKDRSWISIPVDFVIEITEG